MTGTESTNVNSPMYLLNGRVHFDFDKRTLFDEHKNIELTISGARLLNALLLGANEIITRNSLLWDIWEAYNLTASNGNLNKNIFLIRKSLAEFGIHDVLETIPRQGFILHIDVTTINDKKGSNFFSLKTNMIISFLFLILMVAFFQYNNNKSSMSQSGFRYVEKIKMCDIYVSSEVKNSRVDLFLNSPNGEALMSSCDNKGKDVFIDDDKLSNVRVKSELFVAICNTGVTKNETDDRCKNYIFL